MTSSPAPRTGRLAAVRTRIARAPGRAGYVVVSLVAVVLYAVAAPLEAAIYRVPVVFALILPAIQSVSLVAAWRLPVTAVAGFTVASFGLRVFPPSGGAPWPWAVTALISFVLLVGLITAAHGWRAGLASLAVPGAAVSATAGLHADEAAALPSIVVALSLAGAAAVVGALLSERDRMSGQLERERELGAAEHERRLVAEERQRIARELHDVVAHGLSLIQVQATSARYRLPELPERASAEFDDIARSARSSLAEMRRLLGALRGDEAAERAPQPSVDDIPRLVAEAERAGADIRLTLSVTHPVSTAVGIATFRIVQEAISNAVRHAPGAAIDVAVASSPDTVLIEVANEKAAADAPARTGDGHGLVGMRERAALLGGSLQAGPTAAGGFRVAASLPRTPQEEA